jgi:nucleoside-diphosphate-sugar epimerase
MYGGKDVLDANVRGVRNTVGAACELGLDPVLYISTIAAMYPPPGDTIRVDDPIVNLKTTYGRSKAEGERLARKLQSDGAPVVSIYPAGVFGPQDPVMGETLKGLRDALRFGWRR